MVGYKLSKNDWVTPLFVIFRSVREKLLVTVFLDHPVPVGTSAVGTSAYQEYQEDRDQISGATYISDVVFDIFPPWWHFVMMGICWETLTIIIIITSASHMRSNHKIFGIVHDLGQLISSVDLYLIKFSTIINTFVVH